MISALSKSYKKHLLRLFLFILFGLFLDSPKYSPFPKYGQEICNVLMFLYFIIKLFKVNPRKRELMIYAVFVGIIGEYLFSIGLGMYTYHLSNVPHYVPPGHALVYIAVINFMGDGSVKKYRKELEKILRIFILLYGTVFLIFLGDVFGFVMTVLTIVLLRKHDRERLFFYVMYIVVAYLEIVGTRYGCWFWPETAYDIIPFLKSANPPSGISFFYFSLDLSVLYLYKLRHLKAWKRMKNIRALSNIN